MSATVSVSSAPPAHASGSSRKLGQGYSLALRTACGDTHLSLVYFNSCRRGYEQDLVKSQAEAYFQSNGITHIDFELGAIFNERSRLVGNSPGNIVDKIIADLRVLFAPNWDIDGAQVAHIDLRGAKPEAIQTKQVPCCNNWLY